MKYTKTVRANKSIKPAKRPVRASATARRIRADEDIMAPEMEAPAEVTVDEVASTLLFEAEEVAELVSEVTGAPVDVTVDDDEVEFTIGDDVYTITPEGDEEVVEESTRLRKGARRVAASRRMAKRPARSVAASRRVATPRARRVQR